MSSTFAGWLFRPIPIFLTNNLLASFNHIVAVAAIFDSFHVVKTSLLVVRHVASLNVLRWRAGHHFRGDSFKGKVCEFLQKTGQQQIS